ncbi:general substrate transporter [Xylariomycetidae sp. FL2044]|nr:general substrate transporter [Xylariomycetidae sp. FL2044]
MIWIGQYISTTTNSMATAAPAVNAPLLSARHDDDDEDDLHDDVTDAGARASASAPDAQHRNRPGLFVWSLTLSAGISGLLFGYDTGVISATLVSVGTSLSSRDLTSYDKSIITSCTALLALAASPLASLLADRLGRKPVILLADLLFVLGALAQASSHTVADMVVGRSVVGAGVGAASLVTPLYIAELAPAAHRGMLVTMNVLSITLGQVVAYVAGWLFAEHGDPATGWRWMVGLGAVPAVLQCVLLLFMPETPRWLVKAGRSLEARRVIQRTSGSGLAGATATTRLVDGVLKAIEIEVREEQESAKLVGEGGDSQSWLRGWQELFAVPKNRRALTIACLLQGLQQLCGFNSLMYFSATIFTILGFSIPTLTSLTVAVMNFIFTLMALLLIDRVGRRRILLWSIPFMALGLLLSAYGFRSITLAPAEARKADAASAVTGASSAISEKNAAFVILVSIMIYVGAYALGLGNVPWMQSELFPLNVRSLGSGLSTSANWSSNFVVGLTFLPLMDSLSPSWTFVLYGFICAAGWVAVWLIYPETAGLSLEQANGLLENGWGVR